MKTKLRKPNRQVRRFVSTVTCKLKIGKFYKVAERVVKPDKTQRSAIPHLVVYPHCRIENFPGGRRGFP